MNRKYYIIAAAVLLGIVLLVAVLLTRKTTPEEVLYDCIFNATDNIQEVTGYTMKMFVGSLSSTFSYADENENLPTRSFSISALKNYQSSGVKEDVFFIVKSSSGGALGKIIGADLQICNSANKTKSVEMINNSSEYVLSMTMYMHGSILSDQAGTYRADGIIEVDGVKYLVSRIEGIELTE